MDAAEQFVDYRLWGWSHKDLRFLIPDSDFPYFCVDNQQHLKATIFMGARLAFRDMTNVQLQAHIRRMAKDSARVFFTEHAYERMARRSVSDWEVFVCLRQGVIERPPVQDRLKGTLKCTMEHFGSVRNLAVVVALDDEDPDVIVVTVMTRTR